jgi:hypothetical protein
MIAMNLARWLQLPWAAVLLGVACGGDAGDGPKPELEIPCTRGEGA